MKRDEALQRLSEIQRIAETTTLYALLPGYAAIIGGVLVFIGCVVSYGMIHSTDFAEVMRLSAGRQMLFIGLWAAIGVAGIALELILAGRDAKRQGLALFGRPGKLSAHALAPSVSIAIILTVRIFSDADAAAAGQYLRYVPPVWMMCYGAGLYAAGLFSVRLPRLLGIAFILMGAVGLLFYSAYGLLLVALSFGLMHIAFGIVVLGKASRNRES